MNDPTKNLHDQKLDSLVQKYQGEGYSVLREPSPQELPFDLDGYRPDLVATKGDGSGLIVEVKTSSSRISVDRFQALSEVISSHPGWRFLLVTLEDGDAKKIPATIGELPTWAQLGERVQEVRILMDSGMLGPALLYLWGIVEAALRKQAIAQNIPVDRLPPEKLLKHMYSQGEISVDEFDLFSQFKDSRDRLAHGLLETLNPTTARKLLDAIMSLLVEWTTVESA